jgi:hypothetical protein
MGRRSRAWFWTGWVGALGPMAILWLWRLAFAPFSTPGARANQAAVVFLLAMGLRWAILAGLVVAVAGAGPHDWIPVACRGPDG